MKMKKALTPPMTLITLLMSGTKVAMSSVTAIHSTVSMMRLRLSNSADTTPSRLLRRLSRGSWITDLRGGGRGFDQ